jgi:hypothetical protein
MVSSAKCTLTPQIWVCTFHFLYSVVVTKQALSTSTRLSLPKRRQIEERFPQDNLIVQTQISSTFEGLQQIHT